MNLDKDTITMCRLVAFAEEEKKNALVTNFNAERYAKDVLIRFQTIYPDAILILGDVVIGSEDWKESLMKNHVQCSVNGIWTFYSFNPGMSIEIKTDGSISLDEGSAETIFNYVND